MTAITYQEYTVTYGGQLTEAQFNAVISEATAYVDMQTMGRIAQNTDAVIKASGAICDAINAERESGIDGASSYSISSESVGNHSVSYRESIHDSAMKKRYDLLRMYLWNTGLLYRGMQCSHL